MSMADELERLRSLHASGALTDSEFERAKAAALGNTAYPAQYQPAPGEGDVLQALQRSRSDRMLGGICGGLGKATPLPAWLWRVFFVIGFCVFGVGLIPYIILWIFMPLEQSPYEN
jgi:phage shock protein PspC (stress-responsive transcriptional regulator)